MSADPRLAVTAFGLSFANPVLTASGTCGYGAELAESFPLASIGGLCTKGISLEPRAGNPAPRICETAAGMLNSIGLANLGLRAFLDEKLPFLRDCGTRVLVNFFGETEEEYRRCAEGLSGHRGIDALEMNISCPNVKLGGLQMGQDPHEVSRAVASAEALRSFFMAFLWSCVFPSPNGPGAVGSPASWPR